MANMEHVTKNKLTIEADDMVRAGRKKILIFGGALAIVSLFFNVYLFAIVSFIAIVLLLSKQSSQILRSGALGEDLAIKELGRLPNSYTIYNQVNIPNPKSKNGFNEADVIVAGPNAVFVIEVKHNNGTVNGYEQTANWKIEKIGRGGTPYSKVMRNPVAQVKKLVWLLAGEMKKKKQKTWVQGVVLFTHDEVKLNISGSTSVPVMRIDQLVHYIKSYDSKSKPATGKGIVKSLAALKTEHA